MLVGKLAMLTMCCRFPQFSYQKLFTMQNSLFRFGFRSERAKQLMQNVNKYYISSDRGIFPLISWYISSKYVGMKTAKSFRELFLP